MKKTLLLFSAFLFTLSTAFGQCTPDPQYEDETFGVWPDTTQGFADGQVGVEYEQVINMKIPSSGADINPDLALVTIDSARLQSISNLPPGLELVCNSQTPSECTYLAEQLGCGVIQGTPTEAGEFDITINALVYGVVFGTSGEFPYSFDDYSIVVDESSGFTLVPSNGIRLGPNYPNPASEETRIYFNLPTSSPVSLKIYDVVGKEVLNQTIQGVPGENSYALNVSDLEAGVYLYSIEAMGIKKTRRLAVER